MLGINYGNNNYSSGANCKTLHYNYWFTSQRVYHSSYPFVIVLVAEINFHFGET